MSSIYKMTFSYINIIFKYVHSYLHRKTFSTSVGFLFSLFFSLPLLSLSLCLSFSLSVSQQKLVAFEYLSTKHKILDIMYYKSHKYHKLYVNQQEATDFESQNSMLTSTIDQLKMCRIYMAMIHYQFASIKVEFQSENCFCNFHLSQ